MEPLEHKYQIFLSEEEARQFIRDIINMHKHLEDDMPMWVNLALVLEGTIRG